MKLNLKGISMKKFIVSIFVGLLGLSSLTANAGLEDLDQKAVGLYLKAQAGDADAENAFFAMDWDKVVEPVLDYFSGVVVPLVSARTMTAAQYATQRKALLTSTIAFCVAAGAAKGLATSLITNALGLAGI